MSSSIKRVESSIIPSVRNFSAFKGWMFETLNKIEGLIGITPITVISNVPHSLESNDLSKSSLEEVVVDLTNILMRDLGENRKMKTENILLIKNQIISEGYKPRLVVDANTLHRVDDKNMFERLENEKVIEQDPAGRKADIFVLKLARKLKLRFITNDLYSESEYQEEFGKDWIFDNRITFIFSDGVLILD